MSVESERDGRITHFPCGTRTIDGEVDQVGAACDRIVELSDLLERAEEEIMSPSRNTPRGHYSDRQMLLDDIQDELIKLK